MKDTTWWSNDLSWIPLSRGSTSQYPWMMAVSWHSIKTTESIAIYGWFSILIRHPGFWTFLTDSTLFWPLQSTAQWDSSENIAVHQPKSESRAFGDSHPLLTIISVTLPPMCSMVLSASSPAASRRSGWSPAHPRSCKECFNFNSDPQEINWLVVSTPWRMDARHWGSSFCWMENKNRFNNQPEEEKKRNIPGTHPFVPCIKGPRYYLLRSFLRVPSPAQSNPLLTDDTTCRGHWWWGRRARAPCIQLRLFRLSVWVWPLEKSKLLWYHVLLLCVNGFQWICA